MQQTWKRGVRIQYYPVGHPLHTYVNRAATSVAFFGQNARYRQSSSIEQQLSIALGFRLCFTTYFFIVNIYT